MRRRAQLRTMRDRWNACGKHLPLRPDVRAVRGKAARTVLRGAAQ